MKILLFSGQNVKYMGGHFRSMLTTAKYLNINGINVYVSLSNDIKKNNYNEVKTLFPFTEKIVWFKKSIFLPNTILHIVYLRSIIKKLNINVIHSFDLDGHIIAYLIWLTTFKTIKICTTICGGTIKHKYPFSYPIIVYSNELKEILVDRYKYNESDIFVEKARMDIDLLKNKTLRNSESDFLIEKNLLNKKRILFVTRISLQKQNAILLTLKSIKKLSEIRNDFILYIVAFSENRKNQILLEKNIEEINSQIGRETIIYLKYHSSKIVNIYKNFDIVIGVARVCFEAMMNAKPVIIIGENGCSGIIDTQNKSHLSQLERTNFSSRDIKPASNVNKTIYCLNKLIDTSDLTSQYGFENKKWVEKKMDAKLSINTHKNIYDELCKNDIQKVLPLYNVFYMIIIKWGASTINFARVLLLSIRNYFA